MISVVIVNWNSGTLLEGCVQSLLRNAPGCRIIIVDNASTDSSLQFAGRLDDQVLIIRNSRNLGFAAASNIGWRAEEGDRVLFLNPDAECSPESVERLEQTLIADSQVWAAAGQLVSPSGQPQTRYLGAFPSAGRVAAEMLLTEKILRFTRCGRPNSTNGNDLPMDVDQPAAACLMVSRTALELLGGFDESFSPAWFEDVDLCRRIRNRGGRIVYHPKAQFRHHGGYSLGQLSWQEFLETFHRNQIRYFRKHHGVRAAARVRRLIVAGLLLRSALSLAFPPAAEKSRSAACAAYWRAARRISGFRESAL
jgi:N-acetylglucosaminyl-diphospho-decaprenol L-rhamnosyltransferase